MSAVTLCRVCLASNIKMQRIANTQYEEIFQKLFTKLRTDDRRPETVCFICYSQLQRCSRFMAMSRKAEEILTQLSRSGIQLTEETVTILQREYVHKLSWTPLQILCVNEEVKNTQVKVDIKEECSNSVFNLNETENHIERHNVLATIKKEITQSEELASENVISEKLTPDPKILATIKKEIVDSEENEVELMNKKVSDNESEYQNLATIKKEIVDTEEQTDEVEPNKEVILDNERLKLATIKMKLENNLELTSREKLTIAVEQVKLEYESDVETEGTDEKIYEEVTITNPEPSKRVKYPCKTCGKAYAQKCHMYRHMKIHQEGPSNKPGQEKTIIRDYTCELCGKAFIQKCSLKKHLLNHTGEKPFACDLCSTRCLQKIDMVRHMRMHTGQKPFQCDICKQKFSRKSNMKLHMLTHADTKPFICHICNNSFSRRYDLNRHNKRKHTGEKPYSCNLCDFRSVNASYLKTHMDNKHIRTVKKPYSCLKCDFKCANAGYLKIHDEKKHLNGKSKSKIKNKC